MNMSEVTKKYAPSKSKQQTTNINDISGAVKHEFLNFLNDPRKQYKLLLTMIDCVNSKNILECSVCIDSACFWCRNKFEGYPIGCPIRYIPSQLNKTLTSVITGESYTIKENVPMVNIADTQVLSQTQIFETDGIFCSFSCCLAFINDNYHNSMYKMSKTLLMNMYYIANGQSVNNVIVDPLRPAPSWRLLKEYGGLLTIEEFRSSFNKTDYSEIHTVKNIPKSRAVSFMYEERKYL